MKDSSLILIQIISTNHYPRIESQFFYQSFALRDIAVLLFGKIILLVVSST